MKHLPWRVASAFVLAALLLTGGAAVAQPGGGAGMGGPQFSGAMQKLFGDNKAFSATMDMQMEGGMAITMEGSLAFLNGQSRFDVDISKIHGAAIPPQAIAQMKQYGMDKMVSISSPDSKTIRLMYPSMSSYVEMPMPGADAGKSDADFKMETTELGSDTVDGHPCKKNKVIVTGTDNVAHESTVWNATDMNKFPIKIAMTENGNQMTMTFKDVKMEKPDASLFTPPASYKKYDSMMNLMMSRMQGKPGQ